MMRNLIAKYIGYPLQDIIRGTKIKNTYQFLMKTQFWNEYKLKELQLNKLKKLINFAYENVPYYKYLFKTANIKPTDIRTLEDLKKIPITDKNIARNLGSRLYVQKNKLKNIRYGKTGGTTGVPLFLIKDTQTRSFTWGAFYRYYNWMGIKKEDKTVTLWGAPTVTKSSYFQQFIRKSINWLQNNIVINSFNINEKTLPSIIKIMEKEKPVLIRGYLSALLEVAYFMNKYNIKSINPKAISPTTETLLPPYRKILESAFNAPVYDQYGAGECGSIAFECEKHNGLHVNIEHCIVEIIDNNGHDVENSIGDIVITDLDNYAMPFIRYKIGDKAILSNNKCSCGRNHPLIKRIIGRTADTIILKNGSKVHGVFFTDILGELDFIDTKYIKRFQAYQIKAGDLQFRIESDKEFSSINNAKLLKELKRHFNNVKIIYYKRLPLDKSGKFRYVISEINN